MLIYKIDLDNSGTLIDLVGSNGKVAAKKSIRDLEIACLTQLFAHVASSEKNLSRYNRCRSMINELNDLGKDENLVKVGKEELTDLQDGFKKSADGGRPDAWRFCDNIFTQLEAPAEYKERESDV